MQQHSKRDEEGGLIWVWPILAVAVCCGGPALFVLIASAGISGAVVAGLLPAAGVAVALALVAGAFVVWRRRASAADCCAPPDRPMAVGDPMETKAS